jgi:glycosyltransferase involved in cell wall biosynthesis
MPISIQNKSADISVIVPTYNRAVLLRETIESFLQMQWSPGTSYELLIVDNNSKDKTKDVAADFMKQNSAIKYVFVEKMGASYARNEGIIRASGNIVVFVDDDIEFDKEWGRVLLETFAKYPEVCSIGGKIIPVFPEGKPQWINDGFLGIYGDVKMGEEEKYFEFPGHPYGANMSFRREIFKKVGMFNIDLGRKKNILLSNDETGIYYNISRSNLKVLYSPFAIVRHKVPACRAQKKWILKRNYWQGISDVVFEQITNKKPKKILLKEAYKDFASILRGIFGSSGISIKKIYWHIRSFEFNKWADYCRRIGEIRQKIIESLRFNREKFFSSDKRD